MTWLPPIRWRQRSWIVWNSSISQFGLSDRMRAIASGLALAERLNCRLAYRWEPNDHCPAEWSDLFMPLRGGRILQEIPAAIAERAVVEIDLPANIAPTEFWKSIAGTAHAGRFANWGAFGVAWRDAMRSLEPVRCVRRTVRRALASAERRPLIGIHLRRTDMIGAPHSPVRLENVRAFDEALWQKVTRKAIECKDACFVLASDDREYFESWHDRLGRHGLDCVSAPKSWTSEFRQTSVIQALTDLCLLGSCREVLGSMRCGFVDIAAVWGASLTVVAPDLDSREPPW